MKLVPDAKVRLKYQHLITNSFVEVCILFDRQIFSLRVGSFTYRLSFHSVIGCWDGAPARIAAASYESNTSNRVQSRVVVITRSASLVATTGTNPFAALFCANGSRNATTIQKLPTGLQPTLRHNSILFCQPFLSDHLYCLKWQECPKCKATIEKDGGCNHMVCKNSHCKTEFCWVCLGPWEPHGTSWWIIYSFHELGRHTYQSWFLIDR